MALPFLGIGLGTQALKTPDPPMEDRLPVPSFRLAWALPRLLVVYVFQNVPKSVQETPGTLPTSMRGSGTSLGVGQTGHPITLAVH